MAIVLSPGNYFGKEQKWSEDSFFKLNLTQHAPFATIQEHYHENTYLSLLINGNYREKNKKDDQILNPGAVIFRPAGYDHANYFPESGGSCMNIEFKSDFLKQYGLNPALPAKVRSYAAGTFPYLYKLLYCFVNDIDHGLSEEYILNWLGENMQDRVACRLLWLSKVKEILETELETTHGLEALSQRVHVHPVYLARAFKAHEGITLGEYKLKMRLKKAMELLFNTKLSISAIAYTTGFSDTAHFIKSFRLFYPVTPGKFRAVLKS